MTEEMLKAGSIIEFEDIEYNVLYSWWSIEGSFIALEDSEGKKRIADYKEVLTKGNLIQTDNGLELSANVKRLVRRKKS